MARLNNRHGVFETERHWLCARRKRPWGGVSFELVVSGTLLIVLISVVAQVSVSCGRLWQESRSYRLASSELTSQLERLTLLPESQVVSELAAWSPSAELEQVLPGVALTGEIVSDDDGRRLKLSLDWNRSTDAPALVLVGWLIPPSPTTPAGG